MPLFPAYSEKTAEDVVVTADSQDMLWEGSESREAQLLASDTDEEVPSKRAAPAPPPLARDDFYLDSKLDRGNLRVSTLYYPGRPQYERHGKILSGKHLAGSGGRRYWAKRAADAADAGAAAERAAAYRRMLRDRPDDVSLWERFIDFQDTIANFVLKEVCSGVEAALTAAEEAAECVPRSRRLRERLLAAAQMGLPRDRLLQRLRELLASERSAARRAALWERLLAAGGAANARALAAAAIADTRAHPPAYPRLLHAYGVILRGAGLWEELVMLVELLAAMTCAPAAFPPPAPDVEPLLREAEERALGGGLPLSAVWVRVERARAAARWRPAPAAPAPADPQRAPLPHDLADLLQPLVGERHALLLCVALLRLAKVPLLPGAGGAARAWGAGGAEGADCAEALLPLVRAARRLPPAHAARAAPQHARRLMMLLVDPPHYFSDDTGYLSWVRSLWDACCGWVSGRRRAALLGWRLRWLHALLLLLDAGQPGEADQVARIRDEARAALKRFGDGCPLAFGQFARIERDAGGGAGGGAARAGRVALRALRAALHDAAAPHEHALHIARIACEVSAAGERGAALGALAAAVRGRAPPLEPREPAAEELQDALRICEERCEELERRFAAEEDEGEEEEDSAEAEAAECCDAMLPGAGEWAAARALLASPARRARLLGALRAGAGAGARSAAAERYYEQSACALLAASARDQCTASAARALAHRFPHNAYLALAGAGAPLWALREESQEERLGALATPRAPVAALAGALPALLGAAAEEWAARAAERAARAVRRAARGAAGGALLAAAALEAEARASRPRLPHALYAALDAEPDAKWLYVRGAALCGGEAGALADALLARQLRAHALLDELAALAPR